MDITDLVTPIASSNWDEGELGSNEGTLDGNLDFLGELNTETDVTILITDGNDSLESGSLTSLGLLLDGHDLHGLIRELSLGLLKEDINNLGLLNGDGVSVDLLKRVDLVVLDKSSELGEGSPLLFVSSSGSTGAIFATTATAATAATTATTITKASLSTTSFHLTIRY